jgi:predicted NodU family carbamoyl transferase
MGAVLGIAGSRRDATVALCVDGRLAAAAREDSFVRVAGIGYVHSGFPARAAEACLVRAGLGADDVSGLAIVDDHNPHGGRIDVRPAFSDGACAGAPWVAELLGRPMVTIDPVYADAVQAAVSESAADVVFVAGTLPPVMAVFTREDARLRPNGLAADCAEMTSLARFLSQSLGCGGGDPYRSLERLGRGGEPEFLESCGEAIRWRAPMDLTVDQGRLAALVDRLALDLPGRLADSGTLNVRIEKCRRALAASFMASVANLLAEAVELVCAATESTAVVLGGSLFDNPRLNTLIRERLGEAIAVAAIPGPAGRAIGASMSEARIQSACLGGLALGPSFSENDIKTTLENCRLDYVYEPDWGRLLLRVSKMLSRGMMVGWFQGPAGFGPRSLGTRSLLCDPSTVYARENVNVFLKQLPIAEPLPVSMTQTAADASLRGWVRSPFMLFDAPVQEWARPRLRSALDDRNHVQIHTVTPDQAPELCQLLEVHNDRTRVPGLININLSGPGEPTACTPRDAVRTVFSSATDALVIGRFLVMKDYWLLRSNLD